MQTSKINAAFDSAPAALPHLVNLGYKLSQRDPSDLACVMHTIQEAIPALNSRIVMEYTLTVATALVEHICARMYHIHVLQITSILIHIS